MPKSKFDIALDVIERGRQGKNTGIPLKIKRLDEEMGSLQPHESYLIGAKTGEGKSTFADDLFVFSAYEYAKDNPHIDIKIDYFSFEMELANIIAKGILRRLSIKGIRLPAGLKEIFSRGKNRLSDEIYNAVLEEREYFEGLEDILNVHDSPENPTGIFKKCMNTKESMGKFEHNDYGGVRNFITNKEESFHIPIIDHIALARTEKGYTKKANIDKISEYFVMLRKLGSSPVVIQQLSYDIESSDRVKTGRLTPMKSDFGDSKYTTRDFSNIVTLFSFADANVKSFRGVDVSAFGDRLRLVSLLKCRYGSDNVHIPVLFLGESSRFIDIPSFTEMKTNPQLQDELIDRIRKYNKLNVTNETK